MSATGKKDYSTLWKRWNRGDVAGTLVLSEKFVRDYPRFGPGWLVRGDILTKLCRYEEARDCLRKCTKYMRPNQVYLAHQAMGHLYRAKGNFPVAERWFKRALEAKPNQQDTLVFLGATYARQGKFGLAKRTQRRAIRASPDTADEAYLNLGLVLRAEGDFKSALEALSEAVRLDPGYREAKRVIADIEKAINVKMAT